MQTEDREKIRINWVRLSQETPITNILAYFYQEGTFKKTTIEDILWERPSQRSWIFLDTLQRSGPRAFGVLVKALKECGKEDLAQLLEDGEAL